MFQVVRKLVYNRVFAVALAVFRISHGNVARCPAFVLVFLPKELQRHARTFQFLMDILVIRLVIQAFQGKLVRIKLAVNRILIHLGDVLIGYAHPVSDVESSLKCACWRRLHSAPSRHCEAPVSASR